MQQVGYFEATCVGCGRPMGDVEVTMPESGQISLKCIDTEGHLRELPDKCSLHCRDCGNMVALEPMRATESAHARHRFEQVVSPQPSA
jgi:hypothetical protein